MAEEHGTEPEASGAPSETPAAAVNETEALRAEVGELKDRLTRSLAEMENLRKRTTREIADSRQYAVTSFARDMLNVADNLKRAIAAVPAEARTAENKALSAFIEGVEVTERGLEQTLGKFGVKPLDPKGEKFNPDFHQAVFEVETSDVPPGSVAQVMQAGYVIGDRVLRPAMVGVAKAPAGAPPSAATDAN
ncbi:MAG: nucleotide exchange factor GrpE [Rhizobiales bacterium]|nr:nucleotide exchange factor GrpE [Hyphomicrobiales bacterium]